MTRNGQGDVADQRMLWERWTIDEITDGICRLAVARPITGMGLAALDADMESGTTEEDGAPQNLADRRRLAQDVRRAAMALELAPAAETWSPETAAHIDAETLGRFLARRRGKPGLPTTRPLREGDVFIVRVTAGGVSPLSDGSDNADGAAAALAEYSQSGAEVWDVTAAARQSVKRAYHAAIRAGEPEPPQEPPTEPAQSG